MLRRDDMQLSRGESVGDTARILSRHVAAIGVRTGPDALLEELAAVATVPVFNMLTAGHHPCQALADLMTLRETFGSFEGLKVAYVGDGNNVARSLALLGAIAGVEVAVASPAGYTLTGAPDALLTTDPAEAVAGAHAIYADVWVSMGDEDTADERRAALGPYCLDDALLDLAAPDAIALHCLPGAPRRGDHRRGALRRARAHLGSGREPPPRAEGAAGAPAAVIGGGMLRKVGKLGRMSYEDALDLASVFVQVASRQARDALTAARRLAAERARRDG